MKLKQYISDNPIVILISAFVLLYLWQPFFGGLYSDDWGFLLSYFTENEVISAPFSLDRLSHFMVVYANRPISGLMFYIVNSIAGYNLFLVHCLMLIGIYLSAFSIYKLSHQFFKFLSYNNSIFLGAISATIWLISPWTLGATAWYSSSINLVSLIFFSLSIYFVLKGINTNKNYYFQSAILYLISCLTYESFFFQYFSFLLIIWLVSLSNKPLRRLAVKYFIIFSSILLITIVWNRLSANLFEASIHKALNPYLLQTMAVNIVSFPYVLLKGFGDLFIVATLVIVPFTTYLLFKLKISSGTVKQFLTNRNMKIILIFGLAILLGILMYSAAGYTLWAMGSRSRTMFVTAYYIPFILIVFWQWVNESKIIGNKFKSSFLIVLIVITLSAFIFNKLAWIEANNIQKEITTSIPSEVSNLPEKSMVIFVGPYRHQWISVIDAPWAINFQMQFGKPFYTGKSLESTTKARFVSGTGVVHPATNQNYQLYWDGDILTIGYNLEKLAYESKVHVYYDKMEQFETQNLYIWDYYSGTFTQINEPQLFEFEPYYNYDYWVTWTYNWIKNDD